MRVGVITAVQFAAAMAILLWPVSGWAQSSISVEFTPTIEQRLDPRSSPAQATFAEENTLISKGYVKIGTIRTSKPGKKENPDTTKQLEAAILQKAAEAGGDVVHLTRDGALVTVGLPMMERVGGYCGEYRELNVSGGRTISTCVKYIGGEEVPTGKTWKQHRLVSEGTVWRYGPNGDIARAAGEARKAAEATAAFAMLGKDIKSAELTAWMSKLGAPEIDNFAVLGGYAYTFKSAGVWLQFSEKDILKCVLFNSEGAEGARQYQGDLPYGLSFQLTRKEVENVLGPPDKSDTGSRYRTYYTSRGLQIDYNTTRNDDPDARIFFISLNLDR
jgi:hypothetical protein